MLLDRSRGEHDASPLRGTSRTGSGAAGARRKVAPSSHPRGEGREGASGLHRRLKESFPARTGSMSWAWVAESHKLEEEMSLDTSECGWARPLLRRPTPASTILQVNLNQLWERLEPR